MRILWFSCLLIGSVTCGHLPKGRGQSSAQGSSSSLPSQRNPSPNMAAGNAGGYVNSPVYTSGFSGAQGSNYGVHYPGAYGGASSYGSVSDPQDEAGNSGSATDSGASVEALLPVFSDVSNLEPVSSFSSRSRYQRGRAVFVQTRYSPGVPVRSPMTVYKPIMRPVSLQSSPPQDPPKGGN